MFETIKFMAAVIFLGIDLELAINLVENQNKISFVCDYVVPKNYQFLPWLHEYLSHPILQ